MANYKLELNSEERTLVVAALKLQKLSYLKEMERFEGSEIAGVNKEWAKETAALISKILQVKKS
jgi:hypothetical protein